MTYGPPVEPIIVPSLDYIEAMRNVGFSDETINRWISRSLPRLGFWRLLWVTLIGEAA